MDLYLGIRSSDFELSGFKFRGGFPNAPSGEKCTSDVKTCWGARMVRTHLSPCRVWQGSDFARRTGWGAKKFDVFCQSRFSTVEFVLTISPSRHLNIEMQTLFISLDRGGL